MPAQMPQSSYAAGPPAEPAMPDWLRALQNGAGAPPGPWPGQMPGAMPGQAPVSGMPNQPWGMPRAPMGQPAMPPLAPNNGPYGNAPFGGANGSTGFTGSMGGPQPGGLSISSLINQDVLPEWIREAGAAPGPAPQPAAPWGQPPVSGPAPDWGAPPMAPMAPMEGGAPGGLFDDSALPDWLRAAAGQQPPAGYGPGGLGGAADYGGVAAPNPMPNPMPSPMNGGPSNGYGPNGPSGPGAPYAPFAPDPYAPDPFMPLGAASPFQATPPNGIAAAALGGAMPAQSLFDAGALPTWLGGTATPSTPALPESPAGASGLAANSLVDPNALPTWMRESPQAAAEPSGLPAAGTVSEWLASPVTDEPLPGFLDQIYAAADVPRLDQASASPWSVPPTPGPAMGAVPGEQIVDESALPAWLQAPDMGGVAPGYANGGANGYGNGSAMPVPPAQAPAGMYGQDAAGAAGPLFSARDLIEAGAMPPWTEQGDQQGAYQAAPGFADGSPDAGEMGSQPSRSWPPHGEGEPLPAAELPPWLREGQMAAAPANSAMGAPRGGAPDAPDGYAGFEEFQGFDAGDMPMDPMEPMGAMDMERMPDPGVQEFSAMEHYTDRFGAEMPGGAGHFGYQYDYGQQGDFEGSEQAPPEAIAAPKGKGGKRRGFFRRR